MGDNSVGGSGKVFTNSIYVGMDSDSGLVFGAGYSLPEVPFLQARVEGAVSPNLNGVDHIWTRGKTERTGLNSVSTYGDETVWDEGSVSYEVLAGVSLRKPPAINPKSSFNVQFLPTLTLLAGMRHTDEHEFVTEKPYRQDVGSGYNHTTDLPEKTLVNESSSRDDFLLSAMVGCELDFQEIAGPPASFFIAPQVGVSAVAATTAAEAPMPTPLVRFTLGAHF